MTLFLALQVRKKKKVLKTEQFVRVLHLIPDGRGSRVWEGGASPSSLHGRVLALAAQTAGAEAASRRRRRLCKLCGVIKGDASGGRSSRRGVILP